MAVVPSVKDWGDVLSNPVGQGARRERTALVGSRVVTERIVAAGQLVGARLVVVDALGKSAAQFYESLGFRRIPDSLRLVQEVADVDAALG